jgi:hypothetical protein
MKMTPLERLALLAMTLTLAACGGSGGSESSTPVPPPPPPPSADARAAAATTTAQTNADCQALGPFYWEVGDVDGTLASGSVGSGYTASTVMEIASASKWLYAAYVAEKRTTLSATTDIPFLNFTSGYVGFGSQPGCGGGTTVDGCLAGTRGDLDPTAVGRFEYDSGHMQKHASNIGLGSFTGNALGVEIGGTVVGSTTDLEYFNPQIAGDGQTSPQVYARFLRRLLVGSGTPLRLGSLLGSNAVCTKASSTCNAMPDGSPTTNDWHYSLGHWVEDDADTLADNNGAFSSPGAFGFYPWVDSARTRYGIVARKVIGVVTGSNQPEGFASSQCGKKIRLAYSTATPQ